MEKYTTEELREEALKAFTTVINRMSDKDYKEVTEYLVERKGIHEVEGTSKQEHIEVMRRELSGMSRKTLISLSYSLKNICYGGL